MHLWTPFNAILCQPRVLCDVREENVCHHEAAGVNLMQRLTINCALNLPNYGVGFVVMIHILC